MGVKTVCFYLTIALVLASKAYCDVSFCDQMVKNGTQKLTADLTRFYCNPKSASTYIGCTFAKSADGITVEVEEENEYECDDTNFFSQHLQACVPNWLSDCLAEKRPAEPSAEHRLCRAFRRTLPLSQAHETKLICDETEINDFIICGPNPSTAMRSSCAQGFAFNQNHSQCVPFDDTDCPIKWDEMEPYDDLAVADIVEIPESQQCACKAVKSSGQALAYACDPENDHHFLLCLDDAIYSRTCAPDLFWNEDKNSCDTVGSCANKCKTGSSSTTTTTLPPTTLAPTTLSPTTLAPTTPENDVIDITERQRCVCGEWLRITGQESIYLCDPESEDRFLVCQGDTVTPHPCSQNLKWNYVAQACAQKLECLPTLPACDATVTVTPTTKSTAKPTTQATIGNLVAKPVVTNTPPLKPVRQVCQTVYDPHFTLANWDSARLVCKAHGQHLAMIKDRLTLSVLRDKFGSKDKKMRMWIGGSDRSKTGAWKWTDGSMVSFTNWYPGEPNRKKGQRCMQFNYKRPAAWDNADCNVLKPFICQSRVCSPVVG